MRPVYYAPEKILARLSDQWKTTPEVAGGILRLYNCRRALIRLAARGEVRCLSKYHTGGRDTSWCLGAPQTENEVKAMVHCQRLARDMRTAGRGRTKKVEEAAPEPAAPARDPIAWALAGRLMPEAA